MYYNIYIYILYIYTLYIYTHLSICVLFLQHLFLILDLLNSRNVVVHNAAISACEKGAEWQRAFILLVSSGPVFFFGIFGAKPALKSKIVYDIVH